MASLPYLAFLPSIGPWELVLLFGVVLLIFGPQKLPEIAEAMGKSIRKFRSATKELKGDVEKEIKNDTSRSSDD